LQKFSSEPEQLAWYRKSFAASGEIIQLARLDAGTFRLSEL